MDDQVREARSLVWVPLLYSDPEALESALRSRAIIE
eukprot:COSAG06_NODE_26591_length_611_cov_1.291016_2_plen_35_part_01